METASDKAKQVLNPLDRAVYWFSRNWLTAVLTLLAIYVALPILAPTLMRVGVTGPARVIYTMYSPMCHQMASRSFFLFGEQYAYPRALAGTDLQPLESYTDDITEFDGVGDQNWAQFFLAARQFVGNEQLGYKTALCQRDMAIYGFLLLGGVIYALLRRRIHIRPLPFILFILIGMGPIGWDGFSQLFGYYFTPIDGTTTYGGVWETLQWLFPLRESPPILRTGTGALFGFMLAWLLFPHLAIGMKNAQRDYERRLLQE